MLLRASLRRGARQQTRAFLLRSPDRAYAALDNELSRRSAMFYLGQWGTIGPAAVGIAAAETISTQEDTSDNALRLARSVGPRSLCSTPAEILSEFTIARPGDLMPYFQLFWRINRWEMNKLDALCRNALRSESSKWPFRMRVLPALAHIHALGASLPFSQRSHEEIVLGVHRSALDLSQSGALDSAPDREVLDIIWRTMIGALVRNRYTWKSFTVGPGFIEQAELVARKYLEGESVLFGPAILAWQFLLTYEIATRSRPENRWSVLQSILRLHSFAAETKNFWFARLAVLYKELTGFHDVLPQQGEVFMGFKGRSFAHKELQEYFILVQMERFFVNSQYASGRSSVYLHGSYPMETEAAAQMILVNYGINKYTWPAFRSVYREEIGVSSDNAVEYLDDKLAHADPVHSPAEELHAKELSNWVPFRRLDEETFSDRYWKSYEAACVAFLRQPFDRLWENLVVDEGSSFSRALKVDIAPKAIVERAYALTTQKKLDECRELVQSFFDRAASYAQGMVGWSTGPIEKPFSRDARSLILEVPGLSRETEGAPGAPSAARVTEEIGSTKLPIAGVSRHSRAGSVETHARRGEKRMESKVSVRVPTLANLSVKELLDAGGYADIDPAISNVNFAENGIVLEEIDVEIVEFGGEITSRDALSKTDLRAATFRELLAFGARNPHEVHTKPIVALGAIAQVFGSQYVVQLISGDAGRYLGLHWWGDKWDRNCRFLFVLHEHARQRLTKAS